MDEFEIKVNSEEVDLLLQGMETVIKMAQRMKWLLSQVEPYIALMHKVDKQTVHRHEAIS